MAGVPEQLEVMGRTRVGAIVAAPLMRAFWLENWRPHPAAHLGDEKDGSADGTFLIVGTYDVPSSPAQANRILVNYAYFDEARVLERGTAWAFAVTVDDPARSAQISAAVDALFCQFRQRNRHAG